MNTEDFSLHYELKTKPKQTSPSYYQFMVEYKNSVSSCKISSCKTIRSQKNIKGNYYTTYIKPTLI